ncbi:MAG: cupin domain-containing protein, partial [Alphaproteobacteria bacterium]
HWYMGAPLALSISPDGVGVETVMLGPDLRRGERPQHVVPGGAWQQTRAAGGWALAGCTVAPGFDFAGFEMAAEGWEPGPGR